ncbi:hypothetical protein OD91_2682 [Lutibacter sp. Hel_I_33_5]|uniref:hypothetical protein n=1 Tax=Lutibacter sp. Hel_I_33_5 TaxID=1566289 RepID=UPI00119CF5C6|nr:hypothetical protein [Lutibacter sp. Hel_I_33_5]TVZ57361.1 hypothetical protein OD91_2682 [Lutibacter sp. Hel_I_33_5]
MRKLNLVITAVLLVGVFSSANAQLIDEKDVSITLDMQPVLQLEMTTPNQIEFVFDEVNEYNAGITQHGGTILKVSSTVNWDLYAVGRSQRGNRFWDQQVSYGSSSNSISDLPISLLELRQSQANTGGGASTGPFRDYSARFPNASTPSGSNSVFVNDDGGSNAPDLNNKYIAGHDGTTGTGDFMAGGSYLNQTGTSSNFYYVMDYRILPSLPAVFPNAFNQTTAAAEDIVTANAAGNYAEPGVYTMYVQYVLLEDQ